MAIWVLKRLIRKLAPHGAKHAVAVRFSDGQVYTNREDGAPFDVRVTFKTRSAEWRTLLMLPNGFFDAYIDEEIDVEGENPLKKIVELGHDAGLDKTGSFWTQFLSGSPLAYLDTVLNEWRENNIVPAKAIANAEFHYALPVELFRHKLGETVGYSEGIWTDETRSLNQAKHNLYETIASKLVLKPGMTVLEVGSGWGFLPIYLAKNYGVEVIVYNPVEAQNAYMTARFARHGVSDRIRLVRGTHRDIAKEGAESVDRFVSIGVHEHHGYDKRMYHMWWDSISHVLRHGGIGVISTSSFMHYKHTSRLTLKHIWPGGHIPSVPLEIAILSEKDLTLVDWENLWPHYHKTICTWRDRFKHYWPEIRSSNPDVFTERFRRRWTFYLEVVPETFERINDLSHFTVVKGRDAATFPRLLRERLSTVNYRTGTDPVECYE